MKPDFRLNRVFSRPLTWLFMRTPITPNQVTLLSLAMGLGAGVCFGKGSFQYELFGALLYQSACILDNCDGEIARAKQLKSKLGAWLDIFSDLVTDLSLFTGIALGALHKGIQGPVFLFYFLCISGSLAHLALVIAEKWKGFGPAAFGAPHPEHQTRRSSFLTLFDALREGEASWLVLIFVLIGQSEYLLWGGGIYMQALWLSAFLINYKWLFTKGFREDR